MSSKPEAYFDLGEHTLASYVVYGRGRRSSVEVAMSIVGAYRWREGLLIYFKGYTDRAEALQDLGVSAGDLVPIAP